MAPRRTRPTGPKPCRCRSRRTPEPVTFCEPLEGLSMRDLDEPEIFRVFFGETPAVAARA